MVKSDVIVWLGVCLLTLIVLSYVIIDTLGTQPTPVFTIYKYQYIPFNSSRINCGEKTIEFKEDVSGYSIEIVPSEYMYWMGGDGLFSLRGDELNTTLLDDGCDMIEEEYLCNINKSVCWEYRCADYLIDMSYKGDEK